MKKLIAMFSVVFILVLSFTSCVSDDEHQKLVDENSNLKEQMSSMVEKEKYDSAVKENKESLITIKELEQKLEEIEQKVLIPQLKEEAAPVVTAISELGEITLDKEESINNIQNQYDALSDDAKEYVTNIADLELKLSGSL